MGDTPADRARREHAESERRFEDFVFVLICLIVIAVAAGVWRTLPSSTPGEIAKVGGPVYGAADDPTWIHGGAREFPPLRDVEPTLRWSDEQARRVAFQVAIRDVTGHVPGGDDASPDAWCRSIATHDATHVVDMWRHLGSRDLDALMLLVSIEVACPDRADVSDAIWTAVGQPHGLQTAARADEPTPQQGEGPG